MTLNVPEQIGDRQLKLMTVLSIPTAACISRYHSSLSGEQIPAVFTPEQMQAYIQTAQARKHALTEHIAQRYRRGWDVAHQAAQLLKMSFGASRVVLFGSLLTQSRVHLRSDIDLAVWGMDEALYFKAVARLQDIDPEFGIDLVEAKNAYPHIRAAIEQGSEL